MSDYLDDLDDNDDCYLDDYINEQGIERLYLIMTKKGEVIPESNEPFLTKKQAEIVLDYLSVIDPSTTYWITKL